MRKIVLLCMAVLLISGVSLIFYEDNQIIITTKKDVTLIVNNVKDKKVIISPEPHEVIKNEVSQASVLEKHQEASCSNYVSDGTKNICISESMSEIAQNPTPEENTQDIPFFEPLPPDIEQEIPAKSIAPRGGVKFGFPEVVLDNEYEVSIR